MLIFASFDVKAPFTAINRYYSVFISLAMQDTRLNSLVNRSLQWLTLWLDNPWRRLSLIVIALLFGYFVANVISTVTGQTADLDVIVSLAMLGFTELVSWLVYSTSRPRNRTQQAPQRRFLGIELLNAIKIGLIYGFYLEAFKLGS